MKMSSSLSKEAKILLLVGMLYTTGFTIASTFVNVYLIRLTGNMGLMILQSMLNFITLLGAFLLGTVYIRKGSIVNLIRAGIIANIVYYSCILLLKDNAGKYLILLGAFSGIGAGFYFFAFNILVSKLTKNDERPRFFSYQQSFSYIFGVLAPTISGYIIERFTEFTGYYVLFTTTVCVLVLGIILSFMLNKVNSDNRYNVLPLLKLKNNKYWDANKYYNFSYGMREAIFGQIFTVFAYLIMTSENTVGRLSSLMSLIGIASSLLIARKFTLKSQKKYYFIWAIVYLFSLSLSGIVAKPFALVISYILNGIVFCWSMTIYSTMKYELSSRAVVDGHNDGDFIIACEFPMTLGRIVGLFVFLTLNYFFGGFNVYRLLLCAISLIPLVDFYFINKKVGWLSNDD